ncbi:MAG: class IV adenylate cyclase [Nanobdellota archaeon]
MANLNIEIKAHSSEQDKVRQILKARNADFKGEDHQVDTYFKVNHGRLKLREGTIENKLIHYAREDQEGPKQSHVTLYESTPGSSLKEILINANGVLVVVDKRREIYFIENIKFHIDTVEGLGTFIEIEAIDSDGSIGKDRLLAQCQEYLDLFEVQQEDLVSGSYSDMLVSSAKHKSHPFAK